MAGTVAGILLTGNHAARPSSGVSTGTLYACSTHSLIYQTTDTGSTWVTWASLAGTGAMATDTIWDAKGDLPGGTGANTAERLAVGTNGYFLIADSAATTGLRWMGYAQCRKTAGEASSATTFIDSANMSLAMLASKAYIFRFIVRFTTNATTVGIKLAVNGPTGAVVQYNRIVQASAPAATGNAAVHSADGTLDAESISATAGPGTAGGMAVLEGIAINSTTPGNLVLRHASETATETTVLAGSFGQLWEIA